MKLKENLNRQLLLINYFEDLPLESYVDDETGAAYTNTSRALWQRRRVDGGGVPWRRFGRKCLYKKSDILAHFSGAIKSTAQYMKSSDKNS